VAVARPFDLVVIGLGTAGLTATRVAAAELGLRVAAVERARIGGDCLWTGCVPSKSLTASARAAHLVGRAHQFGVFPAQVTVDNAAVWSRLRDVRNDIAAADDNADTVTRWGAEHIVGQATITGPREVTVSDDDGTTVLTTRFILVCTGSRPSVPNISGISDVTTLTNDTLFDLDRAPQSAIIIGAGPMGVETSQALRRLGVAVTLVESADRILRREEPDLADRVAQTLRAEGVDVITGTTIDVVRGRSADSDHAVSIDIGERTVGADALISATGRTADVTGLGLDRLGVIATASGINVDARSRTTVPTIYAVGDAVAGRPRHTNVAAHDAAIAVRDMFLPGRGHAVTLAPVTVFTDPELARVGLTTAEAIDRHGERVVKVHDHELAHEDRARIDRSTSGVVRIITARSKIVGAHVLAPDAGDIISALAIAVRFSMSLRELGSVPMVYPTLSTAISRISAENEFARVRRLRQLARLSRWSG